MALVTVGEVGYPAARTLSVTRVGAEPDVVPAGVAVYVAVALSAARLGCTGRVGRPEVRTQGGRGALSDSPSVGST